MRVPDAAVAEFEGNPKLAWENPFNPHHHSNAHYSECVTGTRALFEMETSADGLTAYSRHQPQVSDIIDRLLSPGFDAPIPGTENRGMAKIDMGFVVKVMGASQQDHLEWSMEKHHPVLKRDSELLQNGRKSGMPDLYMQWLGGANSESTLRIPRATLRTAKLVRESAISPPQLN